MHDMDNPRRADITVLLHSPRGSAQPLIIEIDGVTLPDQGLGKGKRLKLAPGLHCITATLRLHPTPEWVITHVSPATVRALLEGGHTYVAELQLPSPFDPAQSGWTFEIVDITNERVWPNEVYAPRLGEWYEHEQFYGTADNPLGIWRTAYRQYTWHADECRWRSEDAALTKQDIRSNRVFGKPLFERPLPSYGFLGGRYKLFIDEHEYIHVGQVITGHGLLELADRSPVEDFAVHRRLRNGRTVAIGLDEQVDLGAFGTERFTTERRQETK